ncbi:MAG: hypothetical protein Q6363_007780 [Candidatus Njordarchaeota archaeon]
MSIAELSPEAKFKENFMKTLQAFIKLRENRNPQLFGLLKNVPPPRPLVEAYLQLQVKRQLARSKKLVKVLDILIASLEDMLDLFQRDVVILENMMKGKGGENDIEVITE